MRGHAVPAAPATLKARSVAPAPERLRRSRKARGRRDGAIDTDPDQLRAAPESVYRGSEPTQTERANARTDLPPFRAGAGLEVASRTRTMP